MNHVYTFSCAAATKCVYTTNWEPITTDLFRQKIKTEATYHMTP